MDFKTTIFNKLLNNNKNDYVISKLLRGEAI